ncbi:MAG: glycosyl hydrolase family 25 [Prevotella sp.]|nr:glycosyl hydrolase family 25 [Prevotella sp.]
MATNQYNRKKNTRTTKSTRSRSTGRGKRSTSKSFFDLFPKLTASARRKWKRRLYIGLGIVLVLALILAFKNPFNKSTSTTASGYSTTGYNGIDISKHQGRINWKTVAQNRNIQFVYIKATEGASVVDKHYKKNLAEARAAGLRVGSYHFFRAYKSPEEQFRLFTKHVKKSQQDLIPMVDVEQTGNRQVSRQQLQKNLKRFMELMKKHYGKYPLLYSQYRFYNEKLAPEFNRYFIFIARYGKKEPVLKGRGKYNIWQYSERGRIKGIQGYVDLDRFANGTTIDDIML